MEPNNTNPAPAVNKALQDTIATVDRSAQMIDQWRLVLEGMLAQMTLAQESLDARADTARDVLAAKGIAETDGK